MIEKWGEMINMGYCVVTDAEDQRWSEDDGNTWYFNVLPEDMSRYVMNLVAFDIQYINI